MEVDIFSMKIYIVTDVVSDVTYSRKSVNTLVVIRFLRHDIIHWKTAMSYDKKKDIGITDWVIKLVLNFKLT